MHSSGIVRGICVMQASRPDCRAMHSARLLFVDDDPMVLEGILRTMRGRYAVSSATGAEEGLSLIKSAEPFAVVVSDLRMPRMDGITFLSEVRRLRPHTIRILLTGEADLAAAEAAVNDGQVFRFLRKPCALDVLRSSVQAGVEQHNLAAAERDLLEQTLQGTIKALAEVLALTSPTVFTRAVRVRDIVGPFASRLSIPDVWHVQVAAVLSQLGVATLPPELAQKLYQRTPLTEQERALAESAESVAAHVAANIPRLERVGEILSAHRREFSPQDPGGPGPKGSALPVGARLLRIAFDFDTLVSLGKTTSGAVAEMWREGHAYDPHMLTEFTRWQVQDVPVQETRDVAIEALRNGMVLAADVMNEAGVLLMARGMAVTDRVLTFIRNYSGRDRLRGTVRVFVEPV